ncbi:MAG: cysteine hydrolase family protein, partial [Ghiorsea sp.]|nr:cysteine hydrolase family protein [Ghiorsea sp.]
ELPESSAAAKNAASLLNLFREKGLPIVHIQHETTKTEMGFMLPGSFGQEIHPSVEPQQSEFCLTKHFPNAFWKTELEKHLNELGITQLIIAGMMTHLCVSTTVRAAMERGFQTTVIQDACATRSLAFNGTEIPAKTVHNTALAELTLIAQIIPLQEFLAE